MLALFTLVLTRTGNEEIRRLKWQMCCHRYRRREQEGPMLPWLELTLKSAFCRSAFPLMEADEEFRGDLQVALDLYRKAESYVPDNIKLKERWILFIVHVFLCK